MAQKQKLNNRRRSDKQKVWEYMGRNHTFTVESIEILIEKKTEYFIPILRVYELAGYIRLAADPGNFSDRIYKVVKHTGKWSPVIRKVRPFEELYDSNTGETIRLDGNSHPERRHKIRMLTAMNGDVMTKPEVAQNMGLSVNSSIIMRFFKYFVEKGVAKSTSRRGNSRCFKIVEDRRNELLRALKKSS